MTGNDARPGAAELRARMRALFQAATGRRTPHGALAWTARQLALHYHTVKSWTVGRRRPSGVSLAALELLEARYGLGPRAPGSARDPTGLQTPEGRGELGTDDTTKGGIV